MRLTSPDSQSVVVFVIEELSIGGAEQMVMVMANEFAVRNWQVHVICLRKPGELADRLSDQIRIHVLSKKPGIDIALPLRLYRCIQKINPDAVNTHLWVANAWTRIALFFSRIPVISTEHSRDTWKPFMYRVIDRVLALRTHKLVCVSGDTADFYRNEIGLKDSLVKVINNGVNTQRYAKGCGESLRAQWLESAELFVCGKTGATGDVPMDAGVANDTSKASDNTILIGTVGRLVAAKNHRRLIDAIKILKTDELLQAHTIKLIIVGEGEERAAIEHYIAECDLTDSITLTGARRDIPDVLAAFDVFVLSSDREGHPLTALEAQAAGTPVVLTDAGGAGEAIAREGEQVGGVLVECSAEAIAEALSEMVLDPDLWQSRASFAQQFALANFDKTQMVDRYEALFKPVAR